VVQNEYSNINLDQSFNKLYKQKLRIEEKERRQKELKTSPAPSLRTTTNAPGSGTKGTQKNSLILYQQKYEIIESSFRYRDRSVGQPDLPKKCISCTHAGRDTPLRKNYFFFKNYALCPYMGAYYCKSLCMEQYRYLPFKVLE
jgi:hypothetical protein